MAHNSTRTRISPPAGPVTTHRSRVGRVIVLAAATVGLLALGACGSVETPDGSRAGSSVGAATVSSLLDAMLMPLDERSAARALAVLPAAATEDRRAVASPHRPGVTDVVTVLHYGEVTVELYDPSGSAGPLLTAVSSARDGDGYTDVAVGMDVTDLHRRLGAPMATEQGAEFYHITPSGGAQYELSAVVTGDTVTALRWAAFLD